MLAQKVFGARMLLAAVAAVVLGTAFTSAMAAPIVIDDFTVNQGTFSRSSSASGTVLLFNDSDAGSFGGFTSRTLLSQYDVDSVNSVTFSGSAGAIGNGSLTLRHAKGGFPVATGLNPVSLTRVTYSGTAVDLTGGGSNNTLRLAFSGATISGLSPTASLVVSNGILTGVYSGPLLPTTTVGGTTAEIPFSSFTDPSVFSGATTLAFQFENAVFSGAARSAEYTLTGLSSVYVVPEPSTYAMALAGVACGGFSMLRRRKRT